MNRGYVGKHVRLKRESERGGGGGGLSKTCEWILEELTCLLTTQFSKNTVCLPWKNPCIQPHPVGPFIDPRNIIPVRAVKYSLVKKYTIPFLLGDFQKGSGVGGGEEVLILSFLARSKLLWGFSQLLELVRWRVRNIPDKNNYRWEYTNEIINRCL